VLAALIAMYVATDEQLPSILSQSTSMSLNIANFSFHSEFLAGKNRKNVV